MKNRKLITLIKSIKFIFKSQPLVVSSREILLLATVFLNIYVINIWGHFLDSLEKYLFQATQFKIVEFFFSDSFYYLALGTGIYLLSFSIERLREYLLLKIEHYIDFNVKTEFFNKIENSNLEDIEQKKFRDLMVFVDNFGVSNLFLTYKTFTNIVKNIVTGVSALIILISNLGLVSFSILLFALPEAIAGYLSRRKVKKYQEKEVENIKWLDYIENLMTRINYFSEMRVDGTFKNVKEAYSKKSRNIMENIVEMNKHMYIDTTMFSVLGKVFLAVFVFIILSKTVVKRITIGQFKALYDYATSVYESFFHIFDMTFTISNYLDYDEKFFEFKEYMGFGDILSGSIDLPKGTPDIVLKDLDFTYPDGKSKVLENLNIKVKAGERIIIIGDDGSGKTTLIKVLCGLYRIVAGDYEIGGYSIRELARGNLKKKVSVVFQDFVNYNMTLKENVTLSSESKKINNELYKKALKISGVDKLMDKFNLEDNQVLGKYVSKGKDVSPGFWQRLAIARMIYRNKNIFILDEPFTHIDDREEIRILKSFFDHIGRDKSVIFITRDMRHTELFDRVYTLKNGKLLLN